MKGQSLDKAKKGDYILLTTKSNLTFAGTIERVEEKERERLIVFQPSKDSPLWIIVEESFIQKLKVLISSE
ncbi:MAG: hypothetical protein ABIN61_08790 [candidate division WOR-3 bacterium]